MMRLLGVPSVAFHPASGNVDGGGGGGGDGDGGVCVYSGVDRRGCGRRGVLVVCSWWVILLLLIELVVSVAAVVVVVMVAQVIVAVVAFSECGACLFHCLGIYAGISLGKTSIHRDP